jgi:hypothetical protein
LDQGSPLLKPHAWLTEFILFPISLVKLPYWVSMGEDQKNQRIFRHGWWVASDSLIVE